MRILFITSSRVGDAVLTSGLLKHLLDTRGDARFTIACGPVAAGLFEAVPRVDRVIEMRKGPWAAHWRALLGATIATPWSMVVDMRGSAAAWVLPTLRRRIYARRDRAAHRVEDMRHTLNLPMPAAPHVWFGSSHHAYAERVLGTDDGRPLLVLGPTANWDAKIWPAGRFASLVEELTGTGGPLTGARVAVVGGPGEEAVAAPVLAAVAPARRLDLVGRIPLLNVGAVFARASLYIGNDSGLMHLAAAAGAPTLGLFGPTRDENYRPWGDHCDFVRTDQSHDELARDPNYRPSPDHALMDGLPVERVVAAARRLLTRGQSGK